MSTGDPAKGRPFTIGLNETKLGIVAPTWFADTYAYTVGQRQADFLLQTGALLPAERAAPRGAHAIVRARVSRGVYTSPSPPPAS